MSENNFRDHNQDDQTSSDLHISSYFWYMGCDWSPCIKQEIIEDVDVEKKDCKYLNDKPLIIAVFAILTLLGFIVWMRANHLSQKLQQSGKNSVQQVVTIQNSSFD